MPKSQPAKILPNVFASEADAVRAAFNVAFSLSPTQEQAGAVVKTERGYQITTVISGSSTKYGYAVELPKGTKLVALFHTHPKGRQSEKFSNEDVVQAQTLRVPSYIGLVSDKVIRVFDPATDKPERNRLRRDLVESSAKGREWKP